jgi:predicted transcriptional regulator of viral defense system
MDFERLLELVGNDPLFESSLLLAGNVNPANVRLQLSRWTNSGRVYQLRRGLYAIAPPYQKIKPHPFVIANRMSRASYVSCQSALAFYGLIPEYVPATVSVTASRPDRRETPLGVFAFHHVKPAILRGYRMTDLDNDQRAFIAVPEKALLDLIYLQPKGESPAYLGELRLQNLERLNLDELRNQAESFGNHKMLRAVEVIASLAQTGNQEYETL